MGEINLKQWGNFNSENRQNVIFYWTEDTNNFIRKARNRFEVYYGRARLTVDNLVEKLYWSSAETFATGKQSDSMPW